MKDIRPNAEKEVGKVRSVAETSNYEGNFSLLLFNRMRNPLIREQLVDLLYRDQQVLADQMQMSNFEFDLEMNDGTKIYKNKQGKQATIDEIKSFKPKTRDDIREEVDTTLAEVENSTPISISDKQPGTESIGIFARNPYTNERFTDRQMSLIEAHEKGHILRPYYSEFFDKYFSSGFDTSQMHVDEKDLSAIALQREIDKRNIEHEFDEEHSQSKTPEDEVEAYKEYLFSAVEIAERMGQLKNYFGMNGNEEFTSEHLNYAREHYLDDVGFDNGMTQFFQCITKETELNFLRLINNSGI